MITLANSLGIISCLLTILAYIPYLRDMAKGRTHPHTFSWLVWTLVVGIGFLGQVSDHGGAGSWSTGVGALLCLIVFLGSLKTGEKTTTRLDWFCLIACTIGILTWITTNTPLWTTFIITAVDTIALVPTFRKAYHKPYEETSSVYFVSNIKLILSMIALENYSIITMLLPASIIITNSTFLTMLYTRRRILSESPNTSQSKI